jgi:ubiquinone/menaquinone biosynthesis C-methylase UbiE
MKTRAFDETAEGWDAASEMHASVFAPFSAQFAADVVCMYPPNASDAVLEVAAGTGSLTEFLAPHARSVLATDISPLMVDRIARSANANVTAAVMDAERLELADDAFDAVYCMFGVMFFSDRAQGLREMLRVLKPQGRCTITTWSPRSGILRPLAQAVATIMPDSPPAKALSEPPVLGTVAELQNELRAAGLERVEVHEAVHHLQLLSPQAYTQRFLLANPNGVMMRNKLPKHVYDAVTEEIERRLQTQFGDGPVMLEGVANIACGYKAVRWT